MERFDMYQLLKLAFLAILLVTGGYLFVSNTSMLYGESAANWSGAALALIIYAPLTYAVARNYTWGFYGAAVSGLFTIFLLLFNGFYNGFDYLLLVLNVAAILLARPATASLSHSRRVPA
jgi:hypothetical protein